MWRRERGALRTMLTMLTLGPVLLATPAWATREGSEDRSAAAERLYQQAVALLEAGDAREACQRFKASERLDEGIGAMLYVAHCWELAGNTASAWGKFLEAESLAQQRGDTARAEVARSRAVALEPQLSELKIEVDAQVTGLGVTRNGVAVPLDLLGVAVPVDPGPHELSAAAPGRQPWRKTVQVPRGPGVLRVSIPVLEPLTAAAPRPRVNGDPASVAMHPKPHLETQPSWRGWRPLGYAMAGAGALGLGAGAGLGWLAKHHYDESLDHCETETRCDRRGLAQRRRAESLATASTIGVLGGAALFATGAVILYSHSSSDSQAHDQSAGVRRQHWHWVANLGPSPSVSLEARF